MNCKTRVSRGSTPKGISSANLNCAIKAIGLLAQFSLQYELAEKADYDYAGFCISFFTQLHSKAQPTSFRKSNPRQNGD